MRPATELTSGWFDPWAMPGGFDPTGLVKGWAAQRAQRALRQLGRWGVRHALVNAGGDVAVTGSATGVADGRGWTLGIQDPFLPSGLLTTVRAREQSVATSGAYERGSLALEPATGRSVHRLASATVIAADLALADACSTGASVHGPNAMRWLTAAHGVEALLVTLEGAALSTPGWPAGEVRSPNSARAQHVEGTMAGTRKEARP